MKNCRELSEDIGISFGSVQWILTKSLSMRRVAAKFVPKLLSPDQKQARVLAAKDLLDCVKNDNNFIKTFITGDESWVYGYDRSRAVVLNIYKLLSDSGYAHFVFNNPVAFSITEGCVTWRIVVRQLLCLRKMKKAEKNKNRYIKNRELKNYGEYYQIKLFLSTVEITLISTEQNCAESKAIALNMRDQSKT